MKPDTQSVFPGDRFDYPQDVIARLHERAEGYRQSGPSAAHTADLLDEAAGAISALIGRLSDARADVIRLQAYLEEADRVAQR